MSKGIIRFGGINKKHIFPFLLAASEIIYLVFNRYYPVHDENLILTLYSISIGEMLIKFLPIILKIQSYDENLKEKKELTTKKNFALFYTRCFISN